MSLAARNDFGISDVVGMDAVAFRRLVREGGYTGSTAAVAPGNVQANLAILSADEASDFLRFCVRNPKPCPIVGMSEPGDPRIPELGEDLDIRTDIPRYRLWRDGELVEEPTDIKALWKNDSVAFALGCSFSFEEALLQADVPIRHIEKGTNVSMWRTNIQCAPAGKFHGPMVVSMRPMSPADAIRAIQITGRMPNVHGAPVHFGDPAAIGIADIAKPDYGDPVEIRTGEVPVFWACGVTPQSVVQAAKLKLCITHAPGSMLVTDARNGRMEG